MTVLKQISLSEQISKKISIWILILIIAIIVSVLCVSFLLSNQLFKKQVDSWIKVAPHQAITNLIDSDYFSIKREVEFLKSTGLFSSFGITDNQKKIIASFGSYKITNLSFIPINDEAKVVWGYYFFKTDFYTFFLPFLISGGLFLALILIFYFFIRWRIKSNLEAEFLHFNQFLGKIELLTEKIHDVYNEEILSVNSEYTYSNEQVIINKAISRLINEIRKANKSLREAISASEQKRFEEELTRTALQVVHDIGSPLAVLETIVQFNSLALSEDSRVSCRNALSRLRDITNSLLMKAKRDLFSINEESLTQQLLSSLINLVVTEKRLQYQAKTKIHIDFDFDKSAYGLFAMIKVSEFGRILSNIINNSVEALTDFGKVCISLSSFNNYAAITIEDNGRGIPENILSKLGKMGVTYGKTNGLGLGLYHAKNTIESCGGSLEIQSKANQGTSVKICLPKTQLPSWFIPKIILNPHQQVVIIDDDLSIHDVWRERFKQLMAITNKKITLHHFYSPKEFSAWKELELQINSRFIYLCDYEFIYSDENGIDLITRLKINYLSVLVTSRFSSDEIITACEISGIKLLPKDVASFIPIEITG